MASLLNLLGLQRARRVMGLGSEEDIENIQQEDANGHSERSPLLEVDGNVVNYNNVAGGTSGEPPVVNHSRTRGRRRDSFYQRVSMYLEHKLGKQGDGKFLFKGRVEKELVGSQAHEYESLDYDRVENTLYVRERTRLPLSVYRSREVIKWVITMCIGVITGFIAFGVDVFTEVLMSGKLRTVDQLINQCAEGNICGSTVVTSLLVFIAFNCGYAIISNSFVLWEPMAAGSGIPEVKSYLNGIKIPRVVRVKTLIAKCVGVVFTVAGGLMAGKEGPMIHSGAIVAAGVSQGKSTSFKEFETSFAMFRNDRDKRDFVSSGAAAGVAAAFGAPIGGTLFSLEEGSSFWNQSLTWRTLFCCLVTSFTTSFLLSGYRLNCWGQLGVPGLLNFGYFPNSNPDVPLWTAVDLLVFILMSAGGGLLGALFNHINKHLTLLRMKYRKKWYHRMGEVFIIGAMTSITLFVIGFWFGVCSDTPSRTGQPSVEIYGTPAYFVESILPMDGKGGPHCISGSQDPRNHELRTFFCPRGQYNDLATLALNSQETAIWQLFHNGGEFSIRTLLLYMISCYFLACLTYGIGVPSGLFVPALTTGAAYGRLWGIGVKWLFPSTFAHLYEGTFALMGAASFLGGVVRMVISLTVILMEATGTLSYGLPLMVVLMVAKWVGDYFGPGIYDLHIELRKIPLLEWEPAPEMKSFYAAHVMSQNVDCLPEIANVKDIVDLLHQSKHNSFVVVETNSSRPLIGPGHHKGRFLGMILRSHLISLLENKAFTDQFGYWLSDSDLKWSDFNKNYPRYPDIDEIYVDPTDYDKFVDLTPFMNPCAFTVQQIAPLTRCFTLFRTMGLRHLPVVDRANNVVGIITRKDLTHLHYRHEGHAMHHGTVGGFKSESSEEDIIDSDVEEYLNVERSQYLGLKRPANIPALPPKRSSDRRTKSENGGLGSPFPTSDLSPVEERDSSEDTPASETTPDLQDDTRITIDSKQKKKAN
eukprot:Clim_evm33s47 gene=Clim_evmTU33s47